MIVTMRTWQVDRDAYAEFARISEEEYWPVFDGLQGRALGVWATRVGGPERLLLMTRYDSLEHWLGTRAWGPASDRLAELSARRDRLIRDTDLVAMRPLSRRQPTADAPEPAPGLYTLETFRVHPDALEPFRALTEDDWAPWAEGRGGVRLVGLWRSWIGPQHRVYALTRADDATAWDDAREAGSRPGRPLAERGAMSEALDVRLLFPMTRRMP